MNFTEARIGAGRLCFAGAGRAALSAPAAAGRSTASSRPATYQCTSCRRQTSLIAGTIFASTKVPLRTWFRAMYHLTQSKGGISSLELGRRLGVTQNTAWKLKHKLMQVMMERDAGKRLTGRVEIDDTYLGGERSGDKRGAAKLRASVDFPAPLGCCQGDDLEHRITFMNCEIAFVVNSLVSQLKLSNFRLIYFFHNDVSRMPRPPTTSAAARSRRQGGSA